MEANWGSELWDKLDDIVDHSSTTSNLIDKCHKCFSECQQIGLKAASKQKRLLEKLQSEFNDPFHTEFTLTSGLLSIINNFVSIYNISSTFSESTMKASSDYFKKSHSQIKKNTSNWINEKKKMEDELYKERKKYELALRRYRDKYQAVLLANDLYKKTEGNKSLSRSQVDLTMNTMYFRRNEYDQAKQEYAVQLRDFNHLQQSHFSHRIVQWADKANHLYQERMNIVAQLVGQFSKLTNDMISKLHYSSTRFDDVKSLLSLSKDSKLLIQRYKTGDVPPRELQFIDLDVHSHNAIGKSSGLIPLTSKASITSVSSSGTATSSSSSASSVSSASSRSSKSIRLPNNSNHSDNETKTVRSSSSNITNSSNNQKYNHAHTKTASFNLSTNPNSDSVHIRATVQNVKMRNTPKGINPEARLSMNKSNSIFRSHAPWKSSGPLYSQIDDSGGNTNTSKLYQRKPRATQRQVSQARMSRRSRSVSDMISSVVRSSLRLKKKDITNGKISQSTMSHKQNSQTSSDSFESDSEPGKCQTPEIVSTPAEAVAMVGKRKMSAPDYSLCNPYLITDTNSVPMSHANARPPSPDYDNKGTAGSGDRRNDDDDGDGDTLDGRLTQLEVLRTPVNDTNETESNTTQYIGSCVSEFDYNSGDTSNFYLSFVAGDQFYICRERNEINESSASKGGDIINKKGWIYVDTIDQKASGYVPGSFMKIRIFTEANNINNNNDNSDELI